MYDYVLWSKDLTGKPVPACGSDSVGYVDKRLSKSKQALAIQAKGEQLNKNLNRGYIGFSFYNTCLFIPFN